jgi:hypothetical protein
VRGCGGSFTGQAGGSIPPTTQCSVVILFKDHHDELRPIAIECDGHEFHEKTRWQAEHDKRRDRYLALHSIVMFRFTGTEIWRDPGKRAEEVRRAMAFVQLGPRNVVWWGDPLSEKHQEEFQRRLEEEQREEEWREAMKEARKDQERLDFIESEIMSGTYEGYYP